MTSNDDPSAPLVALRDVNKIFGDVVAVDGVTADIERCTSTALIGGNGAGKTTLLRLLAAFTVRRPERPSSLTVICAAQKTDWRDDRVNRLHLRLTAWENIRFHARLFGMQDDVSRKKSEALAVQLGLGGALDRRTEGFSRGMRQKTALIRALVHEPELLLLDEPTAGLDITSARAVRALIASLVDAGRGVVWSTHDLRAARVCERVMVMHNARLVADGRVDALLKEHDTASMEELYLALTKEATPEFQAGMEAVP